MRNLLTKAALGVTLGATALTVAAPADAQYRRYHDRDRTGPAIAAGVAGLAIGAALASSARRDRYYDGRYYDRYYDRGHYAPRYRGYYDRGYRGSYYRDYPRYGYRDCRVRRVYDPYLGRRVRVRYC